MSYAIVNGHGKPAIFGIRNQVGLERARDLRGIVLASVIDHNDLIGWARLRPKIIQNGTKQVGAIPCGNDRGDSRQYDYLTILNLTCSFARRMASVGIRLVGANDADLMIGKGVMAAGKIHFRHVATDAP